MKKGKNILLSIICCLSFLVSLMSPTLQVIAEGDGTTYINKDSVIEYKIKTISNVAGDIDIILYEYQEHYYMAMDTIEKLTGLRTSVSTSGGIFSVAVTDGMRTVQVDLTDRTITDTINGKAIKDSNGNKIVNDINAMLFNNDFLVEAVPFLQYLGASTKYIDGYFICDMNTNSIWSVLPEVIKDLDEYTFDFVSNIPDYKKRLTMDIISDIISGWNFFKSPNDSLNDYYKDALSDVLKVNPYKYNTVINKAKENENDKIFDTQYMLDLADQIKDVGSDSYKAIEDLVLTQKIDSLNLKWNGAYKFWFTDDAQKISKELNKKTVKLYNDTVDGGNIDKVGNRLSLLIFTVRIADSFYETYNYDNDAALCLAKEVENIKYAYSDTSSFYWLSEASKISEDALDNWKNARDSIIDNTVDLMRGEGTDLIISAASSEILLPAKAATFITNILCHDIQEAWHHEAVVMFQEEMNSHCLNVCKKIYQKAMDECFTNEDTITRLVDVLNFYFRLSIAYNDGVKEWGEHYYPQGNWDSVTQKLNEVLALKYYNLLNSSLMPYVGITHYSELNDDVFSGNVLESNPNDNNFIVKVTSNKKYDTYSCDDGTFYFTFDSECPQFEYSNPKYLEQQEKLNDYFINIQNAMDDSKNNTSYKLIERSAVEDILRDNSMINTSSSQHYEITQMTDKYCSIKITNYTYGGGVHGYGWNNGYVINLDEGTVLSLSNLFNPIDEFKKYIGNYIYNEYYTQYSSLLNWNVDNLTDAIEIEDGSNWYIKDDALYIEYHTYTLDCYAAGSQLVSIPLDICSYYWSELASELFRNITPKSKIEYNINSEEYPLFVGIVNTEKDPLNVRKSPSINAEIIGKIDKGSSVDVYSEADGWCEIRYSGQVGYVSKEFINCEIGGYAKPVIYLYPEKETDVSVKVNFKNGRFTCTYPDYNDGWNVTAYPDGKIINKNDNDEYSYLYWEGEGQINYDFSSGFVVKREDTAKFLKEKLSYMGLTPKEYNEFIVYWLPIMQENEYNLVSFQMENYDDSAKLNITPKPDSILRVFMAFKETDNKTAVPQQKLEKFERKGFTVVEWGGIEVR